MRVPVWFGVTTAVRTVAEAGDPRLAGIEARLRDHRQDRVRNEAPLLPQWERPDCLQRNNVLQVVGGREVEIDLILKRDGAQPAERVRSKLREILARRRLLSARRPYRHCGDE